MNICKHCGGIGRHAKICDFSGRTTPRQILTKRLVHDDRACKGQHCAECTPSTRTPQHRADGAETASAA